MDVQPFRGIRYNPSRVEDFDLVVSPPYDVIGGELQAELYRRSPYNVVRVDYGQVLPEDGPEENRYTRASRLLTGWLAQGVLIREVEPAVYYTEEDYRVEGELKTRKGFLATVRLEGLESGLYRPHEKTLAGPKADRLELTRACRTNLSPIFSLYDDPAGATQELVEAVADRAEPLITVRMDDGVVTRLWRVTDREVLRGISETMKGRSFFIADGHHRYETSLAYRDLMREQNPGFTGREPWNYVLMYFANLWAPGLTVLPTHRAVFGLRDFELARFLERAGEHLRIEEVTGGVRELKRLMAWHGARHRFGLAAHGTGRLWLLELRDEAIMERVAAGAPAVLRTLDVTVLHSLVLERLLGIDAAAQETQRNLRYFKSTASLLEAVEAGEAQLGFLLNPTRVDEVKAVAETGEKMPQKSTFFYPKLVTGLVLNPLYDPETP
ncbi:MAG: DUF1015 domain-containing protein [Deltaproteobacteria bacterium]|nr:DUF1015 domain-containing protein [Deltaproteobacteria bacterium]